MVLIQSAGHDPSQSTILGIPHCVLEDDYYNGMYIPKDSIVLANLWYALTHAQGFERPIHIGHAPPGCLATTPKSTLNHSNLTRKDSITPTIHKWTRRRLYMGLVAGQTL